MAGQGWSFDVLDRDQDNGNDNDGRNDYNYNHIQDAIWADQDNADELGEHWSSDTWNEPHAEHVADHRTAPPPQPQYTSQHTQHTSHIWAPPSSPPRHVNGSRHRPTNTQHVLAPYARHDPLPAAQGETNYRRTSGDLTSPYRPATFTGLSPQIPPSRSGIESFLRRPNQEEEARHNAVNQSILDDNSQVVDSDSDNGNMPRLSRPRPSANNSLVDLTQSPGIPPTNQSRIRTRSSTGDAESARKRIRQHRVVVDDDEVFEDEAPSAEAELLQAQQADALKMQETNKEDAAVKIGKRNCIICLESYTNATTAICGHIFCHECLTRALMASEKNNDRGKGNCPACRKAISRKSAKEVIPISFLKKSAFKTKGRQAHNK